MLGRLCTRLGILPVEAREMAVADYLDLAAFWSRSPPPDLMLEILGRLWGWKPPEPEPPQISFAEAVKAQGDTFAIPKRWLN